MSEDERLLEEARRSREETEAMREAGDEDEPAEGEPREKTSSDDADSVSQD
jgi:hypothetical protein